MPKKKIHISKAIVTCMFLCFLLTACPQTWYFKITDYQNPSQPLFEISRSRIFSEKGISFSPFDIDEVTEKNELIRVMWALQPVENVSLNMVHYGKVPQGYRELCQAVPLEIGKIYRVHGEYFFRFVQKESMMAAEVYDHRQFHETFGLHPKK